MGDELFAGRRFDTGGSLAQYIADAMDVVRGEYGLPPLPPEGADDRMVLYLAIARGIVDYLQDFEEAFVIEDHGSTSSKHDDDDDGWVRIQVRS